MPNYPHAGSPVAVLVDGSFFLHRYRVLYPNLWSNPNPKACAEIICEIAEWHAKDSELYRIFFYDCFSLSGVVINPISKAAIDFSASQSSKFRTQLYEELRACRKVALRMGTLKDGRRWSLDERATKAILDGTKTLATLTPSDVKYEITQKGVDMRIGLDIASLTFKKQVKRIVLVSGDHDFVPAAKLARREGVDFILDSMQRKVRGDLFEHIDGLVCAPLSTLYP